MKRILIVKLWAIGDIVMATPLIAALRARYPGVHITWAVEGDNANLLDGHRGIDAVYAVPAGRWRRLLRKSNIFGWLQMSSKLRRELGAEKFDAVINCHPEQWWTAILCPAPVRIALFPGPNPNFARHLYTSSIAKTTMHETRHYLRAVAALDAPAADLSLTLGEAPGSADFIAHFESKNGLSPSDSLIVLAPFSSAETKNWGIEHYTALANALRSHYSNVRVVITCGPSEVTRANRLMSGMASDVRPIAATDLSLSEFSSLIRRASVVVTGDSSPLHIAAAVGTPFVAIFGSTDPKLLSPLIAIGTPLAKSLPCAPCWSSQCRNPVAFECMKLITPEEVLAEVEKYIGVSAP